ncbi:8-amino-7-oxononanoate synthase [Fundidesulfovibrio magnetotacticus]|uniref:8-amino-7-oxononanoate synthase n=1 Tax=Fundidesulfovibrio magnetotacticus TaxID=2730080 RepID=A0A6V8M0H7_9BACT|nr:pyridoxal phosphate-dependent aminotransferase family protein [Fundidesulfovibrio magnetotacticus]GFK95739.1 8-amino-7-oxononanoate synthase [Fundidesulfovibrio magnetotacticus]
MKLHDRCQKVTGMIRVIRDAGIYPYFRPISRSWGTEVECAGKRLVMIGSNDYLGLSHDARVKEASAQAIYRMGTGPGGSRFLSGNMVLHQTLEERLAAFVGKKRAVLHVTGFSTNLGALGCLLTPSDYVLCDRENHASIFAGLGGTKRMGTFAHNDAPSAARKIASEMGKPDFDGQVLLITEGIFSMSGDVAVMDELAELKKQYPDMLLYLDDAHGLGVLGANGRGTAEHFGVTEQTDFIMGTFSKAFASIGGFVASDHTDVLDYIQHQSRTQIFSAALPAACTTAALTCIDILEAEPERVERLRANTRRMRQGYKDIGLRFSESIAPIIPITIGSDEKAFMFAQELFERGIFALPAIYPAVPRGQALIRTACMSTHEDRQMDFVLEVMDEMARKYRIRIQDQDGDQPEGEGAQASSTIPGARSSQSLL